MHYLKTALIRFILPLAITLIVVGLALAHGQFNSGGPLWAGTNFAVNGSADRDRGDRPHRYYDRERKDYHKWTEQEERAYKEFLKEQRKEYREFAKADRKERREYWHWRHEHPGEIRVEAR